MEFEKMVLISGFVMLVVGSTIGIIGCNLNNNRFIKEGYHQEHFEYCSDVDSRIIWVK